MFSFKQKTGPERPQRLLSIPIDDILPNRDQPRRVFDERSINELARSIEQYGLMQPVLVRRVGAQYELIAGERRWRACKQAGFTHIDALLSSADDTMSACMALVENLQRENLHFFEEAESYLSLMREYSLTQEELALRIGKNQSTVANKLRVYRLPPAVKEAVRAGRLTERHARALLRLPDEALQLSVVEKVREKLLSVKDTERMIERILEKRAEEREREREAERPRVIRLVRDKRLFVNTLKSACAELRAAGLEAECRVVESETEYQVTVAIPKDPARPEEARAQSPA